MHAYESRFGESQCLVEIVDGDNPDAPSEADQIAHQKNLIRHQKTGDDAVAQGVEFTRIQGDW
ncbi:MAG: hypothetical protein KGL42_11300 [Betaproteobacteria bacterium]|nr:hypothetical protein [Betaproteobacteria bacterium]